MTPQIKYGLLGLYAVIGLGFALYQHFATHDLHGFAYHLGQGLVWPAVMFPAVGKLIGGVIMLVVIGTLILANS
jgi:hypothetical protein